jgi:hypothetical protein
VSDEDGPYINIGGKLVDLNSGMLGAFVNPPAGFASKHQFAESDVANRLRAIRWLSASGTPFTGDLTMPVRQLSDSAAAFEARADVVWENAELEAQNQLSMWLSKNAPADDQRWNELVENHKRETLAALEPAWAQCQATWGLPKVALDSFRWDTLNALMANSYLYTGHSSFFFLELLTVYEAGHWPCGWEGQWPDGVLLVF